MAQSTKDASDDASPKSNGGVVLPALTPNSHSRDSKADLSAVAFRSNSRDYKIVQSTGNGQPGSSRVMGVQPKGCQTDGSASASNGGVKLDGGAHDFKPSPIQILNRDAVDDVKMPVIVRSDAQATDQDVPAEGKVKGKALAMQPIGTQKSDGLPSPPVYFTTDVGVPFQGSHYVSITFTKKEVENFSRVMEDFDWQPKILGMKAAILPESLRHHYVLCFDDKRAAANAIAEAEMAQISGPNRYASQPEYASMAEGQTSSDKPTYYDGQLIFMVRYDGDTTNFDQDEAVKIVHDEATKLGDLFAFKQEVTAFPELEFRAEYFKITEARKILDTVVEEDPLVVGQWHIATKKLKDITVLPTEAVDPAKFVNGHAANGNTLALQRRTPSNNGESEEWISPTGRTSGIKDTDGNMIPGKPYRILPKVSNGEGSSITPTSDGVVATRGNRIRFHSFPGSPTPSQPITNGIGMSVRAVSWGGPSRHSTSSDSYDPGIHQQIFITRIVNGFDVRTTVMLRNLPNKLTCHQLKRLILDVTSFGKYDFSYLRIDFEKGTNVGYAFVNFDDAKDIIPFYQHWVGRPWILNSNRTGAMSYATIQGRDCLVEKFRNSAILSEFKDYRPKLWYIERTAAAAGDLSLVGTEETFPGPNNMSKKQRSLENAAQIGLYAPHSGHGNRERGRHSNYDRGTPAQLQEEAYHNMVPNQHGNGFGFRFPNDAYPMSRFMPPTPVSPFSPFAVMPPYDNEINYGNGGFGNGYSNGGILPFLTDGSMPPQGFDFGVYANAFRINRPAYPQRPFGVGPGFPASRRRNLTNGRLGGRPIISGAPPADDSAAIVQRGGPVQSPYADMRLQPLTEEDIANGYNNTPGPFFCPKYQEDESHEADDQKSKY